MHNRLSTGDRTANWSLESSQNCVLCLNSIESRDHLFFSCGYSAQVWTSIAKHIFRVGFSTDWYLVVDYVSNSQLDCLQSFLTRYTLQTSIHTLWREINARRHGDEQNLPARLIRWIDKHVQNQLSAIRFEGDRCYDKGLQLWFEARGNST